MIKKVKIRNRKIKFKTNYRKGQRVWFYYTAGEVVIESRIVEKKRNNHMICASYKIDTWEFPVAEWYLFKTKIEAENRLKKYFRSELIQRRKKIKELKEEISYHEQHIILTKAKLGNV